MSSAKAHNDKTKVLMMIIIMSVTHGLRRHHGERAEVVDPTGSHAVRMTGPTTPQDEQVSKMKTSDKIRPWTAIAALLLQMKERPIGFKVGHTLVAPHQGMRLQAPQAIRMPPLKKDRANVDMYFVTNGGNTTKEVDKYKMPENVLGTFPVTLQFFTQLEEDNETGVGVVLFNGTNYSIDSTELPDGMDWHSLKTGDEFEMRLTKQMALQFLDPGITEDASLSREEIIEQATEEMFQEFMDANGAFRRMKDLTDYYKDLFRKSAELDYIEGSIEVGVEEGGKLRAQAGMTGKNLSAEELFAGGQYFGENITREVKQISSSTITVEDYKEAVQSGKELLDQYNFKKNKKRRRPNREKIYDDARKKKEEEQEKNLKKR